MQGCRSLLLLITLAVLSSSTAAAEGAADPPLDALLSAIPFAEGPVTRVMVDLAPRGHDPFVMMLDTGAAQSVITPIMARRLGVRVRATKSTPYRRATVLGRDLQFWVDTQAHTSGSATGWEYGLLGGEFIDDYVVEIDYPGRTVRFYDKKKYEVPKTVDAPDERVVRFKKSGTRIFTDVEIGGKKTQVLVDTGAPLSMALSGKSMKQLGLPMEDLPAWGKIAGVVGETDAFLLQPDVFRWAGFEFEQQPTLVTPRGLFNMGGNTDSALGYDVLRQFVIRIDYRRKRLWLKRSGDPTVTFFGDDWERVQRIGAMTSAVGPGHFQVWNVRADGPAARLGLRENDNVVTPQGDPPLTAGELAKRIEGGGPVFVMRPQGDAWIDLQLPAPSYTDEGGANADADAESNAAAAGP